MSERRAHGGLEPGGSVPAGGEIRVRVRYCECDPMGVAHHAAYVAWLEMARTEMLRESGVTYRDMERAGIYLVVTRMEIRYRRPARYDDEVLVRTRVVGGGRARLDHEYEVRSVEASAPVLAEASTTLACVDSTGRVCALPEWLRPEAHGEQAQPRAS